MGVCVFFLKIMGSPREYHMRVFCNQSARLFIDNHKILHCNIKSKWSKKWQTTAVKEHLQSQTTFLIAQPVPNQCIYTCGKRPPAKTDHFLPGKGGSVPFQELLYYNNVLIYFVIYGQFYT